MKIITFYLPQFHEIPENNEWWGKGFTEWVNMKKAKPLFRGHRQPRVPLDHNYYDLSDVEVMRWQAKIAAEHGVYGFCFYHYWFGGHLLLQKPVENYLAETSIDFPYCICWANEHWTNAWVSKENKVLIEQNYGDKPEWRQHYEYLKPYLSDPRYIRQDGKPLVVIYRPDIIDCLDDMLDCWQAWAKEDGFGGLTLAYQSVSYDLKDPGRATRFDYDIEYQPGYARAFMKSATPTFLRKIYRALRNTASKVGVQLAQPPKLTVYSYRDVWEYILSTPPVSEKSVPCGFIDWDNTPRRGNTGVVFDGMTPELFESYMEKLIVRARDVYHRDFMFFFAWNEWAEGGYLEPDEENGYKALEAIEKALAATGEFPKKQ